MLISHIFWECLWIKAKWWLFNHIPVSWICLPHCTAFFCSHLCPNFRVRAHTKESDHANYHSVKIRPPLPVNKACTHHPFLGNSSSECMTTRAVGARGSFGVLARFLFEFEQRSDVPDICFTCVSINIENLKHKILVYIAICKTNWKHFWDSDITFTYGPLLYF